MIFGVWCLGFGLVGNIESSANEAREGGVLGTERLMDLSQALRDGDAIGAPGNALLTGRTGFCLDWQLAILLQCPIFQSVAFIVGLDTEEVGNRDLLRSGKTITTVPAESLPNLPHPVHEVGDLLGC